MRFFVAFMCGSISNGVVTRYIEGRWIWATFGLCITIALAYAYRRDVMARS